MVHEGIKEGMEKMEEESKKGLEGAKINMESVELKKLMTRVAKGEISMEEAELLMKGEKSAQTDQDQATGGIPKTDHTRKRPKLKRKQEDK